MLKRMYRNRNTFIASGECKMVQPLWERVQQHRIVKQTPYNQGMPHIGFYQSEQKTCAQTATTNNLYGNVYISSVHITKAGSGQGVP